MKLDATVAVTGGDCVQDNHRTDGAQDALFATGENDPASFERDDGDLTRGKQQRCLFNDEAGPDRF